MGIIICTNFNHQYFAMEKGVVSEKNKIIFDFNKEYGLKLESTRDYILSGEQLVNFVQVVQTRIEKLITKVEKKTPVGIIDLKEEVLGKEITLYMDNGEHQTLHLLNELYKDLLMDVERKQQVYVYGIELIDSSCVEIIRGIKFKEGSSYVGEYSGEIINKLIGYGCVEVVGDKINLTRKGRVIWAIPR